MKIYKKKSSTNSKLPAVIDQKTCRSDYVHSVISIYSFYSQKKTLFSSQDVIDCDKENYGCKGGNPVSAMLYFQAKGLSNGTTYKYVAKNMTCQKEKFPSIANAEKLGPCGVMIDGKQYDSDFMKAVVAQMGPITVFMSKSYSEQANDELILSDLVRRQHEIEGFLQLQSWNLH